MKNYNPTEILSSCLLAGQIMMTNGAETSRVEETISRMAHAYQLHDIKVAALPTFILLTVRSPKGNSYTDMVRLKIDERATNFDKVVEVNKISRQLAQTLEDPQTIRKKLEAVQEDDSNFAVWQEILGVSLACGAFSYIIGGAIQDLIPTVVITALSVLLYDASVQKTKLTFFSEFISAAAVGLMSYYFPQLGFGQHFEYISIGALMCFVPGVAISNTFQDFFSGHILSGLSMLGRSLLTALAVGLGIVVVLNII